MGKIEGNAYNYKKTKINLSSDKENQEQRRMRVGWQGYDSLIILPFPNHYSTIFRVQTIM